MRELPQPFENDDEVAAATAVGILNQVMTEATSLGALNAAIERVKRFLDHEQAKRSRGMQDV